MDEQAVVVARGPSKTVGKDSSFVAKMQRTVDDLYAHLRDDTAVGNNLSIVQGLLHTAYVFVEP